MREMRCTKSGPEEVQLIKLVPVMMVPSYPEKGRYETILPSLRFDVGVTGAQIGLKKTCSQGVNNRAGRGD